MPTLTNVVEIVMEATLTESSFTKNIDNVFHFRLTAGALDSRINILNSFNTTIRQPFTVNLATTDYTVVDIKCRLIDDALEQFTVLPIGVAGLQALPRLPGDTAVVTPFKTLLRGKNFRGSKHWSAIPLAMVTKDELNGVGIAAWGAFVPVLFAGLITSGGSQMFPIVLSRTLSQLRTNPTTIIGADVSIALLNKTIGTMRRRKEKTVR